MFRLFMLLQIFLSVLLASTNIGDIEKFETISQSFSANQEYKLTQLICTKYKSSVNENLCKNKVREIVSLVSRYRNQINHFAPNLRTDSFKEVTQSYLRFQNDVSPKIDYIKSQFPVAYDHQKMKDLRFIVDFDIINVIINNSLKEYCLSEKFQNLYECEKIIRDLNENSKLFNIQISDINKEIVDDALIKLYSKKISKDIDEDCNFSHLNIEQCSNKLNEINREYLSQNEKELINEIQSKIEKFENKYKKIDILKSMISNVTFDSLDETKKAMHKINLDYNELINSNKAINNRYIEQEISGIDYQIKKLKDELNHLEEMKMYKTYLYIFILVSVLIIILIQLKKYRRELMQAKKAGFNSIKEHKHHIKLQEAKMAGFSSIEAHEQHKKRELTKRKEEELLKKAKDAGFNSVKEYEQHTEKEKAKEMQENQERTIVNAFKYPHEKYARVTYSYNKGAKKGEFSIAAVIEVINWTSSSVTVRRDGNNGRLIETFDANNKSTNSYIEPKN